MVRDGGPAFPIFSDSIPKGGNASWGGMTLRDFFAGQALNMAGTYNVMSPSSTSEEDAAAIVKGAYALADAMLKEREKKL